MALARRKETDTNKIEEHNERIAQVRPLVLILQTGRRPPPVRQCLLVVW